MKKRTRRQMKSIFIPVLWGVLLLSSIGATAYISYERGFADGYQDAVRRVFWPK